MKKFTKYPSSMITASSDANETFLGYGIDYRNMRTAIHGIIWSPDKDIIDTISTICSELELASDQGEESTYNSYMGDLEEYLASKEVFLEEEIDFRDITKDDKYYCEDGYIQIINPVAVDLYW